MKKLLPLAAAVLLLGAGCAASSTTTVDTNTNANAAPSVQTTPTPATDNDTSVNVNGSVDIGTNPAAANPTAVTVSIQGFAFSPASFTLSKGTSIMITNNDSVPHTLTADDGSFDSGTIQPGATATINTSNIPSGTHAFHCTVHPSMKGSLIVQ